MCGILSLPTQKINFNLANKNQIEIVRVIASISEKLKKQSSSLSG